jgi:hypothetical protein
MTPDQTQEVEQHIERCWYRGDSIGETRLTVERATGFKPAAHEVQRIFAELSHSWTGASLS